MEEKKQIEGESVRREKHLLKCVTIRQFAAANSLNLFFMETVYRDQFREFICGYTGA